MSFRPGLVGGSLEGMGYRVLLAVYGLINIAGGLMAFLMPTVRSVWSLVVGGTCGLLFLWFSWVGKDKPGFAFRSAAALCVALACFWVYRLIESNNLGKPVMMPTMNLALAVVVFGILGIGHMSASKKSSSPD